MVTTPLARRLWASRSTVVCGMRKVGAPHCSTARLCSATFPKLPPHTVAVGVSGGVDSSVTAMMLKQQGYNVVGVHMKNWDSSDEAGRAVCPATIDRKFAKAACDQIGIPFVELNFVDKYWRNVFTPFLEMYEAGLTPNPDVWCNREIKFGAFMNACLDAGAWKVATGHYAKLHSTASGEMVLSRAADYSKDQSYFLCGVKYAAYDKVLFPLGDLKKTQVRDIATQVGLCTAERKDSMGICFIGPRRLDEFLPEYFEPVPGVFVDIETQSIVGKHAGAQLFTVGQGAKISGAQVKWFVCKIDAPSGKVFVAPGSTHPALYTEKVHVRDMNWLVPIPPTAGAVLSCRYRVRHRQDELGHADVEVLQDGSLLVHCSRPQRAAAPGQVCALYERDTDRCLGGGVIDHTAASLHELGKPVPADALP